MKLEVLAAAEKTASRHQPRRFAAACTCTVCVYVQASCTYICTLVCVCTYIHTLCSLVPVPIIRSLGHCFIRPTMPSPAAICSAVWARTRLTNFPIKLKLLKLQLCMYIRTQGLVAKDPPQRPKSRSLEGEQVGAPARLFVPHFHCFHPTPTPPTPLTPLTLNQTIPTLQVPARRPPCILFHHRSHCFLPPNTSRSSCS